MRFFVVKCGFNCFALSVIVCLWCIYSMLKVWDFEIIKKADCNNQPFYLEVDGEACVEVEACLGVVPWGVELVFGEVVAVGVGSFEVAIDAAIGFVASVE